LADAGTRYRDVNFINSDCVVGDVASSN